MYTFQDMAGGNHIAEDGRFQWRDLEEDLVVWWLRQSEVQTSLLTTEGEHLIVVDPGRSNDGPGPDILDCHLILDDREVYGSVEMHRLARDWYGHKHAGDPKYRNVVLHVVEVERGGPDLPTLVVPQQLGRKSFCLANRPISQAELFQLAQHRFHGKVEHLQLLGTEAPNFSPVFLGLCEILLAGPRRPKQLQALALQMGLSAWPDIREWQGSNQSCSHSKIQSSVIERLLQSAELFDPNDWRFPIPFTWGEWVPHLARVSMLGVSRNQGFEWVVNVLAPYYGLGRGFEIWLRMRPFRHYGSEKWVSVNLGVGSAQTIAEQQAMLEWRSQLCQQRNCTACPLTHSHQTLALIN